jgi:hypothetical protein
MRQNNKLSRLKLEHSKNRQEYYWNILESANNGKKIGPISVGFIGHKIKNMALNLESSH